jgi:hypothetical protein
VLHGLDALWRRGGAGKPEDLQELVVEVDDVVDAFALYLLPRLRRGKPSRVRPSIWVS